MFATASTTARNSTARAVERGFQRASQCHAEYDTQRETSAASREVWRPPANDAEHLVKLTELIKYYHGHVLEHENKALIAAVTGGQFVTQARPYWRRLRARGECKLTWDEWLRVNAGIGERTAATYARLFKNWERIRHLPPGQQSIRAALRMLDGDESVERPAQLRNFNFAEHELVALSERHELQGIAPVKLVAVLNELLQAMHISKTVTIKCASDESGSALPDSSSGCQSEEATGTTYLVEVGDGKVEGESEEFGHPQSESLISNRLPNSPVPGITNINPLSAE